MQVAYDRVQNIGSSSSLTSVCARGAADPCMNTIPVDESVVAALKR